MKGMETIEDIYEKMFQDHETVLASRRLEKVQAANPYGCNQYGHRKGHQGGDSSKQKEQTKEDKKPEPKKEENDDNSWSDERSHDYKEWRHDIEEVIQKTFSHMARNGYVGGIYFDGENFYTDNQDGRATLLYTADDIDDFLAENAMEEARIDDQVKQFMQTRARDLFDEIDWDEVEENKKHYDKWSK